MAESVVIDLGDVRAAAEPDERIAHLSVLRVELPLVREILEAAAAADPEVPARRLDTIGARLEKRRADSLREALLHLRHARLHEVTGKSAANEHDEAVDTAHAVAAVRQRVDAHLDLVSLPHRHGHRTRVAAVRPATGPPARSLAAMASAVVRAERLSKDYGGRRGVA